MTEGTDFSHNGGLAQVTTNLDDVPKSKTGRDFLDEGQSETGNAAQRKTHHFWRIKSSSKHFANKAGS